MGGALIYVSIFLTICPVVIYSSTKTLVFTNERPDGSAAEIDLPETDYDESDFTLCVDFYITSVKGDIHLVTSNDFQLLISSSLDKLMLQFKGIWYYAFDVPNIQPLTWGRLCLSYNSKTYNILVAFDGTVCLSKSDPKLLSKRILGKSFLSNLALGKRTNTGTFVGKMTEFYVWIEAEDRVSISLTSSCARQVRQKTLGNI